MVIDKDSPFCGEFKVRALRRARTPEEECPKHPNPRLRKYVQVGCVRQIDLTAMRAERVLLYVDRMDPESAHYDPNFKLPDPPKEEAEGGAKKGSYVYKCEPRVSQPLEYVWEDIDVVEIIRRPEVL